MNEYVRTCLNYPWANVILIATIRVRIDPNIILLNFNYNLLKFRYVFVKDKSPSADFKGSYSEYTKVWIDLIQIWFIKILQTDIFFKQNSELNLIVYYIQLLLVPFLTVTRSFFILLYFHLFPFSLLLVPEKVIATDGVKYK